MSQSVENGDGFKKMRFYMVHSPGYYVLRFENEK